MELGTKKVYEAPKERMWWKREIAVDMGGEQDTLTRLRLRLRFPPRQAHGLLDDQP